MEPTATVTFLFTDVEGSSRRWEARPDAMSAALARHDELLAAAVATYGGTVFKHTGDGICAVFRSAPAAAAAALTAQRSLTAEAWGDIGALPVRMVLHTGTAEHRGGDWYGPALNRTARLLSIAHGGQVVVSLATAELIRDHLPGQATLVDLGEHRLADLARAERVFQLTHPTLRKEFPPLRSVVAVRHNLPPDRTRFVGRHAELHEVTGLLGGTRLLTLTGVGGTGKTRLAVAAAASVVSRFPDGVFLIELASFSDPPLLPAYVFSSIGGTDHETGEGSVGAADRLTTYLAAQRALLVLDNCEHLLDAVGDLAEKFLDHCPHLSLLATSREALGIPGEQPWRVPSLSLPPAGSVSPAGLAGSDAVALFCDRAKLADPSFVLTGDNAGLVSTLCRRLDGLPLALELAAARLRALSLEQITQRLDDRLRLLSGGARSVPRQRTLQAAIDWSWELLSKDEQALLRRLSVFAGNFSLPAAEAIGSDMATVAPSAVLDLLTALIDKSLVTVERGGREVRYNLSETVRQYAEERLVDAGDAEAARDRHLGHFLSIPSQSSASEWQGGFRGIAAEHANIRAALEWSLARGAHEAALRLAGMLLWYWVLEGAIEEGRTWLERALAASVDLPGPARGPVVAALAYLVNMQGDLDRASTLFAEARRLAEAGAELGDQSTTVLLAALVALRRGNLDEAQHLLDDARTGFQKAGWPIGEAWCRFQEGWIALAAGDEQAATAAFETALSGFRSTPAADPISADVRLEPDYVSDRIGPFHYPEGVHLLIGLDRISGALHAEAALAPLVASLGDVERAETLAISALSQARSFGRRTVLMAHVRTAEMWVVAGRPDQARQGLGDAVNTLLDIGGREWVADILELSAIVLAAGGHFGPAARLLGAAERLREKQGGFRITQHYVADARSNSHAALGAESFAAAVAEGRNLSPEQALRYAVEHLAAV
jgi:predicted ATPase/class 3 adenylate cyclase